MAVLFGIGEEVPRVRLTKCRTRSFCIRIARIPKLVISLIALHLFLFSGWNGAARSSEAEAGHVLCVAFLLVVLGEGHQDHGELLLVDLAVPVEVTSAQDGLLEFL